MKILNDLIKDLQYIDRFGLDKDGILFTTKDAPFILAEDIEKIIKKYKPKTRLVNNLLRTLKDNLFHEEKVIENITKGACLHCGKLDCIDEWCFK